MYVLRNAPQNVVGQPITYEYDEMRLHLTFTGN